MTREKALGEDWPREALDDIVAVPDEAGAEVLLHAVGHLSRKRRPHAVVALEEFDVVNAALVREHLLVPGMRATTARKFRDKLTMRVVADEAGIRVPEFVHALNYEEVGQFMERVPPPWVLKPRSDVSAAGIRKLDEAEQVWRAIDELDARAALHDRSPYYLLERYVAGEVFHVDSLVEDGRVVFAGASRYGRPPMDVMHGGGVFTSYTVEYDSKERGELLKANRKLLKSLGLESGAAHAEFIKGAEDGQLYFLEVAARVGGAYIAETLEAASGVNLWREWARAEVARAAGARGAGGRAAPRLQRHRALARAAGAPRHLGLRRRGDRLPDCQAAPRRPHRPLAGARARARAARAVRRALRRGLLRGRAAARPARSLKFLFETNARRVRMSQTKEAPYGSWQSPITSDMIVSATVGLGQIALDGEDTYWIELRPAEGGRNCLVRRTPDGQTDRRDAPRLQRAHARARVRRRRLRRPRRHGLLLQLQRPAPLPSGRGRRPAADHAGEGLPLQRPRLRRATQSPARRPRRPHRRGA